MLLNGALLPLNNKAFVKSDAQWYNMSLNVLELKYSTQNDAQHHSDIAQRQ